MDSSIIFETLKGVDTSTVLDTLRVKVIQEEGLLLQLNKIAPFVGIIGGVIVAFVSYLFTLHKDRKIDAERVVKQKQLEEEKENTRYSNLRANIIFSAKHLLKATNKQKEYLIEFNKQFKEKTTKITPPEINPSFNVDNFLGIPRIDINNLFIQRSTKSDEEKGEALQYYNFIIGITKKISENIEAKMNACIVSQNKYTEGLNEYNGTIIELINRVDPSLPFKQIAINLHKKLQAEGKIDDLFYAIENFDKPLLELAKNYHMIDFAITIPKGINLSRQVEETRLNFYNIYERFIGEMKDSIDCINTVITFLEE